MSKDKKAVVAHHFVIPTGTQLTEAPHTIKLYEPHYECYIETSKDNTMRLLVPESVVKESIGIFKEIE